MNIEQNNLLHILIIGPLLFGIGYKNQDSSMEFYYYLSALTVILPFITELPPLNFEVWEYEEYINIFKLLFLIPFFSVIIYKRDESPQICFHLLKILGIANIVLNCYLLVEKIIKRIKSI